MLKTLVGSPPSNAMTSLSGAWEAREGSSFIGLQIHLMTQVKDRPLTLRGVDQTFLSADIAVYERNTSERKLGDGNWYEDELSWCRMEWVASDDQAGERDNGAGH
jgi:hypothetical protein